MAPRFLLHTLGGLWIDRRDASDFATVLADSKSLFIPAILATRDRREARREELAEVLWPDGDRRRSLRALRQALFYLSQHAEGLLERDGDTLRLDPSMIDVDLWQFEAAVAAEDDRTVIELYQGRFAAGLEPKAGRELELWIDSVDGRLAVAVEVSYTRAIAQALSTQAFDEAVGLAKRFSALNPLDEYRHRRLVETLTAAGQDVQALQALEAFRRRNADEEPEDEDAQARLADVRREVLEAARSVRRRTDAPAGPSTRHSAGRRRARWPTFAAGAVVGLAVAAAVLVARLRSPESTGPLAVLNTSLFVAAGTGTQAQLLRITASNGVVRLEPSSAFRPGDLPTPDRRTVATTVAAGDGWNIGAKTAGSERVDTLTTEPGDEEPVGWSPDGRFLMYRHAQLQKDGSTRTFTLSVLDRATGVSRPLGDHTSHEAPAAAWRPSGTKIVLTADVRGMPDVLVMDVDGSHVVNVSDHAARDGAPSWSPSGTWLAFVSERDGDADLYVVRPDGGDLRRVTRTPAKESSPVWLTEEVLVFLAESGGDRDLYAVHTGSGEIRRLTERGDLVAIVARDAPPPPWIDRLRIAPRPAAGSPGQHLAFSAELLDPTGQRFASEPVPIAWSISDPSVATLRDSGRVLLDRAGRTWVIATAAGWRSDTLSLYSLPMVIHEEAPLFVERWAQGLDTLRWRPFGDPVPVADSAGGPDGTGVLHTAGDEFFASGVITRSALKTTGGVAVEVAGRLPFTGKLHQEFGVALYDRAVPDSLLQADLAPAVVEFRIRGRSADAPAEAWVATTDRREAVPLPERLERWKRYTLQVTAEGTVELLVDGRMHWRSPFTIPSPPRTLYLGLGFQSFDADLLHGTVAVYGTPRYRLPDTLAVEPAS